MNRLTDEKKKKKYDDTVDDSAAQEAVEAARVVGITMLATMRQQFGSLDNIVRIVKVNGGVVLPFTHATTHIRS